ncbi:MAG: DNA polymerase III subunit chi [Gammaproteobacteria bacterium]|nr:DNA polymerase III subunit chi [Gammaproteobacteria bacterium]
MTRVDFYLLPEAGTEARSLFACRLAEKAYALGHRIYVHVDSPSHAQQVDELLWTFRAGSFVPHARLEPGARHDDVPVLIGHAEPHAEGSDVLINLAAELPAGFERFARVAELVERAEPARARARERYRRYREEGHDVNTHDLTAR